MVVTQRNPPTQTSNRKHNKSPHVKPTSKKSQPKQKDTFKVNTNEITSPGDFVNGKYIESSSPSRDSSQQSTSTLHHASNTTASPIRPSNSLHTNSTPLVNMGPRPTNLYYTPAPVHCRNYSTPAIYPMTTPPTVPQLTSHAKYIPYPSSTANKDAEPSLLAPSKMTLTKQSPSVPIPISATKPGVFNVAEIENFGQSPNKKSENYELCSSPGSSPPLANSAPKRLQNAIVKPSNTRYYSDGNYANAPHPSDLPRPQFF